MLKINPDSDKWSLKHCFFHPHPNRNALLGDFLLKGSGDLFPSVGVHTARKRQNLIVPETAEITLNVDILPWLHDTQWYSCQQSLLQYFYEACQDLAGFKDSSFSCFKRQNVAHDWIFASSTLEAWDAWKTYQVLTSMDILRLPLEQLLQGEGSREFSRDLRMLMLNGDFWHMMTQDSPEDMKSLWRTHYVFPFL